MNMKHIAFLTLSMSKGGAERVIANLCNEYLVDRYQITIITCMKRPLAYALDSRIQVLTIDQEEKEAKQNMGVRFLRRRKRLCKILGEITPDILLCFLPEPNMLACSLKQPWCLRNSLRFPVIISVRNDPVREYKSKPRQLMMRLLYPKADGYVFQTKDAMEYFHFNKHIAQTGCIIPNPLSRAFIGEQISNHREPVIVSVGSLSKQKNQKLLLHAFARIADAHKEMNLIIYGEGSLREELQQEIDQLGLTDRVSLAGNSDQIIKSIQNASLFVMSSDYEGMPNALIEAMALGLPVISTDCPCGGPKFLIQDGVNGRLSRVGDETQLAQIMNDMMQNPEQSEKMAKEATKMQELLHPDKINRKWEDYIKRMWEK